MIFPNANKYYLLKYNKGLSYISTQTFIYSITDKFGTNSFKNSMKFVILSDLLYLIYLSMKEKT